MPIIASILPCLIYDANLVISQLKDSALNKTPLAFEMDCTMLLSGDHNKKLRQAIAYVITGKVLQFAECSFSYVYDFIKSNHLQTSLF
jgi:hypothetical protein